MQNVIAFPKKAVAEPVAPAASGAKTLFLHVRRTTLIVHLAAQPLASASGSQVSKQF